MNSRKVYYAHFMGIYNTPQEDRDISTLTLLGFEVVNPNNDDAEKAFKALTATDGISYLEAFQHVFLRMVGECDVFAFKALPDGRISSGVAMELEYAQGIGMPIIELPSGTLSRVMTGEETREYLRDIGQR